MPDGSPVFVVDRSAIERTGAVTVGDLIQDLPSIAGAATNPSVNNGGGDGASTVSLRGLGEDRTLLLLNGRRMVTNDINSIPVAMIERIEVLKDGASAVYGSDAIAGVVNFILKKDFNGAQFDMNYGISDRDDGERVGGRHLRLDRRPRQRDHVDELQRPEAGAGVEPRLLRVRPVPVLGCGQPRRFLVHPARPLLAAGSRGRANGLGLRRRQWSDQHPSRRHLVPRLIPLLRGWRNRFVQLSGRR
jgi:hypothetical protein